MPTTLLSDAERMVFGGLSAVMAQVRPLQALLFVFYRLVTASSSYTLASQSCVQPIETVKVRLQNEGTARQIPHSTDSFWLSHVGGFWCFVCIRRGGGAGAAGQVQGLRQRLPRHRGRGRRARGALQGTSQCPYSSISLYIYTERIPSYPRSQGMAPSIGRELCYSTLRFGLYSPIKV